MNVPPDSYGAPDLVVGGFKLWVHGREFAGSQDYYDGNWLRVTARCNAHCSSVWAQGSILMVTDIVGFGEQCSAMLRGDSREAVLDPIEPELSILLKATDGLGHIDAEIEITPEHLTQNHRVVFELDQSYLPALVAQCSSIAREYPVRGI